MTAAEVTTHDGLTLKAQVHGDEDAPLTVVLAHCWAADAEDWHYQVQDLLDRYGHGVRVLTWDQRGHGRSDAAPRSACTVENLGRDLGAVVDAFAPRGPLVLAGHSIGGMTLMTLPQLRPDLVERTRAVLFTSTSSGRLSEVTLGLPELGPLLKGQIPRVLGARAKLLSRKQRRQTPAIERFVVQRFLFGEPMRPRDAGLLVDQVINCPPATMRGFYEDLMHHDRLADLTAYDGLPVVVLVGDRDLLTPPDHARRIAASIGSARLLVAPGAGHMLPLERNRLVSDQLIGLVENALRAETATGRPEA